MTLTFRHGHLVPLSALGVMFIKDAPLGKMNAQCPLGENEGESIGDVINGPE